MIIAIDGPSASGKSTIARKLASRLGCKYLDSGAMYRAITLYCLNKNINIREEALVIQVLPEIEIDFQDSSVYLNSVDVSDSIRENIVSRNVSQIAAIKEVRDKLNSLQRKIGSNSSIVVDGRDTGTVVFPNAELKIFMTASSYVRAKRRQEELLKRGEEIDLETLIQEIEERDYLDSTREESPLVKAQDAIELNTDELSIDEVLDLILKLKLEI